MPLVFDHKAASPTAQQGVEMRDWKQMAARCRDIREQVVRERREAGEIYPDMIPVVSRRTGELRYFNFDLKYPGSLNHAEALITGLWRLATKEEEKRETDRQEAVRRGVAAARIGDRMSAVAMEASAQVAKATENAVAQAMATHNPAVPNLNITGKPKGK